MNYLKCNDYFIIKIRCYASKYYMKKFISSNSIAQKKQWEAAENYNNFYWKFIKRVTGNKMEHYFWKYMLNSKDCAQEEIHETHGIIIVNGEGYYTYFIPKKIITLN